ncbi:MAG: C39 family peptidase [Chloroflexi bacterium]|nr:C39 family peptidase [Chloroflexota bacterium]
MHRWLNGSLHSGARRAVGVLTLAAALVGLLPGIVPTAPAYAQNVESAPAIEPATAWAKTAKETAIWSGWDSAAVEFAKIPKDITVQMIELRGARAYVYFPGDGKGHKAGEVWIDRADLTDAPWPRWARARRATHLRTMPNLLSEEITTLTRGQYIETTGETRGRWAQAFYLTDRAPGEWVMGWVDGLDLMLPRGDQAEISTYMLTRTALMTSAPDLWLRVPYRSQIDGSPYADANCGPTSVAMALEALGKSEPLGTLREMALTLQENPRCDDCGTYIQHLAAVAEMRGAKSYGLRQEDGGWRRWTLDDIRAELRQQRVVIPQVKYRQLPGRGRVGYGGDHYIVLVGIAGQSFIYNDPVDSDGRGYGRLISAEQLEAAMSNANGEFARTAFAVGK